MCWAGVISQVETVWFLKKRRAFVQVALAVRHDSATTWVQERFKSSLSVLHFPPMNWAGFMERQ